jgi:hypothetical protein
MGRFVGWLCLIFVMGLRCTTRRFRDGDWIPEEYYEEHFISEDTFAADEDSDEEGTDDDDGGSNDGGFWDEEQEGVGALSGTRS